MVLKYVEIFIFTLFFCMWFTLYVVDKILVKEQKQVNNSRQSLTAI